MRNKHDTLVRMELWALDILPAALLILSSTLALLIRWRSYPALAVLATVNVARSMLYLAGFYGLNSWGSRISAVLLVLAAHEAIRRVGFRGWRLLFCIGQGATVGAMTRLVGDSADPIKAAAHAGAFCALAVALFCSMVSLLPGRELMRQALLLLYCAGVIATSRDHAADRWETIIATESVHVVALSGLVVLAWIERRAAVPRQAGPAAYRAHLVRPSP